MRTGRLVISADQTFVTRDLANLHDGLVEWIPAHGLVGSLISNGRIVIPASFMKREISRKALRVRSSEKSRFGYINQKGELAIPTALHGPAISTTVWLRWP
jgi:hypothetical protein